MTAAEEEREAALDALHKAAQRYAEAYCMDEGEVTNPFVQSWVLEMEVTSVELERENRALPISAAPVAQQLSTSLGLSHFAVARYTPRAVE